LAAPHYTPHLIRVTINFKSPYKTGTSYGIDAICCGKRPFRPPQQFLRRNRSSFVRDSGPHGVNVSADSLGVALDSFEVQESQQFDSAFDAMKAAHAGGLIVLSDSFATFHGSRLAELAAKYRIPTIYGHSLYVEAGGLMSYGPSLSEVWRHGASSLALRVT
jgi:hypothetical protein